jgi:hypothetical protein
VACKGEGQPSGDLITRIMQTDARLSLQDCLDSLTNDESPPLNGLSRVEYIVLRRVNARKGHVYVEFVDGDVKDGNEWSEGPFPEYMTIKGLFEIKDNMDRGARREVYGRRKLRDGEHSGSLMSKECWYDEQDESSDGDDMVAVHEVGTGSEKGASSEGSDKNVSCESSSAAPRSSTSTRQRTSREMEAKRTKSCHDAGDRTMRTGDEAKAKTCAVVQKPKAGGVDHQNPELSEMETKSVKNEGVESSERKGSINSDGNI